MSNLGALRKAEEGMDDRTKTIFESYLLGSLGILMKKEDWEEALATAAKCMAKFEQITQSAVSRG